MDISRALKVDGWMQPSELRWLAEVAARSRTVIELGSFKGRSTVALGEHVLGQVIAVDHWRGDSGCPGGEDVYQEFCRNTSHLGEKLSVIRRTTADAALKISLMFPSGVDLVFIDDDHAYENVYNNIVRYRPLVRRGGIIAGHDYGVWPGVERAVRELIRPFRIVGSIWWHQV